MESLEVTKTPEGFHIEGFPDAVRAFRIQGLYTQRLADLALYEDDLNSPSNVWND